jgi:hypothetical protein
MFYISFVYIYIKKEYILPPNRKEKTLFFLLLLLSHSLRTLPPYQPKNHLGAYEVQDTFTPSRYYPSAV